MPLSFLSRRLLELLNGRLRQVADGPALRGGPARRPAPGWQRRLSGWLRSELVEACDSTLRSWKPSTRRQTALLDARTAFRSAIDDIARGRTEAVRVQIRSRVRCTSCGMSARKSSAWCRAITTRARRPAASPSSTATSGGVCTAAIGARGARRLALTRRVSSTRPTAPQSRSGVRSRRGCSGPRKSALPSSTPLWRSSAYAVVTWKKKFGSTKCFR